MSTEHSDVYAALFAFQGDMPELKKDGSADTGKFTYSYVQFDHALPRIVAKLQAQGLVVFQPIGCTDEGQNVVETHVLHPASQTEIWGRVGLPDGDPQSVGSAITYYRRYSLLSLLGLVADSDDDGAAAQATSRSTSRNGGRVWPPSEAQANLVKSLIADLGEVMGEGSREVVKHLLDTHTGGEQWRSTSLLEGEGIVDALIRTGALTKGNVGGDNGLIQSLIDLVAQAKQAKKQDDFNRTGPVTTELPAEPVLAVGEPDSDDDIPF